MSTSKRKKMLIIFIFPIICLIWMIGWTMYRIPSKNRKNEPFRDAIKEHIKFNELCIINGDD